MSNRSQSLGVAVFAYNRPELLKQVLAGLRRNEIDHLYIFADGPAHAAESPRVEAVRRVISNIDWCRTNVVAHDRNVGLARSIISGVRRVLQEHDRIVVVEDDCVPSSNFIEYMRACFNRYESVSRVMHVSGYGPDIDIPEDYPYDVYLTRRTSSWGWGTWKSAWRHFDHEALSLEEVNARSREIRRIVDGVGRDILPMMKLHLEGEIDSWAVWWSYAVARAEGLAVNPVKSKIRNIGHGGGGTHSGETDRYEVLLDDSGEERFVFPEEIRVDERLNDRYVRWVGGGRWQEVKRKIAEVLKRAGLWGVYKALR